MTTGSDDRLGQNIAALFSAQRANDLPPSTILSQVQDLLGADTTLLGPLRDLLLRPAYRQLLDQASGAASRSQLLAGRDALLQDLGLTYHPAVVARLALVIDGSLALPPGPGPSPAGEGSAYGHGMGSGPGVSQPPPSVPWSAGPAAAPDRPQPSAAPVQVSSGPGTVTALLIALVSLLSGAVLLALGWLLFSGRPTSTAVPAAQVPVAPARPPAAPVAAPAPSSPPKGTTELSSEAAAPGAWGGASEYKFGQLPGGSHPSSCAFSVTDASGRITTDKSRIE